MPIENKVLNYMDSSRVKNVNYNKKDLFKYQQNMDYSFKRLLDKYGIKQEYCAEKDVLDLIIYAMVIKEESDALKMIKMEKIIAQYKADGHYAEWNKYKSDKNSENKCISLLNYIASQYRELAPKVELIKYKYHIKGALKILKTHILNFDNVEDKLAYYSNELGGINSLENMIALSMMNSYNFNIQDLIVDFNELDRAFAGYAKILYELDANPNKDDPKLKEFHKHVAELTKDLKEAVVLYDSFKKEYNKSKARQRWGKIRKHLSSKTGREMYQNKIDHNARSISGNVDNDFRFMFNTFVNRESQYLSEQKQKEFSESINKEIAAREIANKKKKS